MAKNDNHNNKKSITGKIGKVIFLDTKSGRSILSVIQENGRPCCVIGNITGIEKDSCITATGSWKKDEKYGWQFMAESIEAVSETGDQEPVEDGLIHALDFSNVLNKKYKKFRHVVLKYEYDNLDEEEFEDLKSVSRPTKKEEKKEDKEEKKEKEKKQDSQPKGNTKAVDGALYNKDMTKLISGPKDQSHFSIPNSVTCIGGGAFSGSMLESIDIPESVKTINNGAFSDCHKLNSILLPHSVEIVGANAFRGCTGLKSVSIPESVTCIGEKAFYDCNNLEEVCITNINAWYGIDFQFSQSSFYKKISDYSANPLVYAHQLVLNGKIVKDLIIPDNINSINDISFINCKCLEHVIIPNSVNKIGKMAFYGCENMVIDIPESKIHFGEDAFKGCTTSIKDRTVNIEWVDVDFHQGYIRIPDQLGSYANIEAKDVDDSMNSFRRQIAKFVPYLIAHFDSDGSVIMLNARELHDAVTTLQIKNNLAALIRNGYDPTEILKKIDGLSRMYIHEFIPRDMTPYINFLLEKHATDRYPIVPIVEYIGGRREEGALYTIMIDDQPNIVWENNNDARSTYVFPCSEEDYEETRQLVFDYIMAEEIGKRKLLHTDKCTTIFKEKPLRVVHNSLKSWASKIMRVAVSEIDVEDDVATPKAKKTTIAVPISSVLTKDQRKELTKATIHIEYELDPELHFYDDQMWDDDGDPVELYYAGEKSLSRERDFKVTKRLINEALADCGIESIEDVYELLCEYVAGFLGDDIDEVSEGVEVSIEIEGSIVYTTNIGS